LDLDDRNRSDVSVLANRGVLSLVGGVASGTLSFLAIIVVTRGFKPSLAGQFFVGVGVFSIASHVLVLGSDIGLLRSISADRVQSRGRAGQLLQVAIVPIFGISALVAAGLFALIPALARLLSHGAPPDQLAVYLRALVIALPVAVVYLACVSATRGFGTVTPFVLIERVARPLLQVLFLAVVVALGLGGVALAGAWAVPFGIALALVLWWLWRAIRRELPREPTPKSDREWARLAIGFWRFATPRGLAAIFQVLILWLDSLLIGVFRAPGEVAIYTTSTRCVLLASFVTIAITQAVTPQIGEFVARGEMGRAEGVFRTATVWGMLLTWPLLLTLAIFAPVVLAIFGPMYAQGQTAVVILALSMMIGVACGPVDWVLLMAGKSSWNLINTAVALCLNVGLNLVLIPRFGIVGAAIAWAVSIIVNNVAPLIEVMRLSRIDPFGPGYRLAAAAALFCFGVPGVIFSLVFAHSVPALVVSTILGCLAYFAVLRRFSGAIHVAELRDVARFSRRRRDR
jgi:O-antigen/teichoic acid export membrane protein